MSDGKEIDSRFVLLMAQIMKQAMKGYRIAELFNDINKRNEVVQDKSFTFQAPGDLNESKENYVKRNINWINGQNPSKIYRDDIIIKIAKVITDDNHVYFDDEYIIPDEKIKTLKKMIAEHEGVEEEKPETKKKRKKRKRIPKHIHGRKLNSMLAIISDSEFRDILRNDIKEIEKCIDSESPKAAVILAGCAVESILTDWLNQMDLNSVKKAYMQAFPKANKALNLKDMSLNALIKVSEVLGLIESSHAQMSDGIKEFRNLVHPGISIKKRFKATIPIANMGLQLIQCFLELRKTYEHPLLR